MKLKILLLLFICAFTLTACTEDKNSADDMEQENSSEQQSSEENASEEDQNDIPETAEEKAYADLYQNNSVEGVRSSYSDLEAVFQWEGFASMAGNSLLPFSHAYSPSADLTFISSASDNLVAICTGKQESAVLFDSENCEISPHYVEFFVE